MSARECGRVRFSFCTLYNTLNTPHLFHSLLSAGSYCHDHGAAGCTLAKRETRGIERLYLWGLSRVFLPWNDGIIYPQ